MQPLRNAYTKPATSTLPAEAVDGPFTQEDAGANPPPGFPSLFADLVSASVRAEFSTQCALDVGALPSR